MFRWVWIGAVGVLVVGCLGLGGYVWWQHDQIGQLQDTLSGASTPGSSSGSSALNLTGGSASGSTAASASDVVVAAASFPTALSKQSKHLVLSLHLPTGFNALDVSPSFSSQQAEYAFYITGAGDILARWLFSSEGTASVPAKVVDGNDELDVTALDAWMKVADPAGVTYSDGSTSMSVAQKSAFVTKVKSTSAACTKDPNKGFATADGTFNICVSLVKPQQANTDWGLSVTGYGEPGGVPTYLRGLIDLPGSTTSNNQSEAGVFVSELKQLATQIASGAK